MINATISPGLCYWVGLDGNTYGLTPNGYIAPPLTELVAELQADFQAAFGPNIQLDAPSPDGQVIGIMAGRITLQEELNDALYNNQFPDTAQGQNLSNVCSITNFTPLPPTSSVLTGVTVTGTPGTVIPDSFQGFVTGAPTSIFQVLPGQFYTVGSGGTVNINMAATQTGPIACPTTSLNILTPVSGITAVSNPNAASLGSNLETASQIRLRRILTLAQSGPNLSQIIAAILKLPGVTNAGGVENDTDSTDGNGNLPHSVAILVQGTATNAQIAQTIFNTKAAGINTNGNTSVVVLDSQKQPHTIKFSTPSSVNTYIDVTYVAATNALDGIFPTNGVTAIQNAVLAYYLLQVVGQDVVLPQLAQFIMASVPGIVGLTIKAGLAPSPSGTSNLAMLYNQLAVTVAGNVTVHT